MRDEENQDITMEEDVIVEEEETTSEPEEAPEVIEEMPETIEGTITVEESPQAPSEPHSAGAPSITLLVKKTSESLDAKVMLNPQDAEKIQVEDGSIIEFEDPLSGMWGATTVIISSEQPEGSIGIEAGLAEACGLEDDFEVDVRKFIGTPIEVSRIQFGVEPIEGEASEAVKRLLDARADLEKAINGRIIFRDWVMKLPDLGVLIHVVSTEPELVGKNIAIVNLDKLETYDLVPWRAAVPFNAVLLIDVSKSMLEKDMLVRNVQPTVEAIKSLSEDLPELNEFISKFKEGEYVRRLDGAIFAALLYLVEKVGRGYGEKIAVITYSEEASPLSFLVTGGQKIDYFDPGKSKMSSIVSLASLIIDKVQKSEGAHTNMSAALNEAARIINEWDEMGDTKPKMIILLTDGFPDYWEDAPPVEIAHEKFAHRNDTVIYTIGIGQDVSKEILRAIAEQGRGRFAIADDLGQLLVWYQRLARDLVMRISVE